MSAAVSSFDPYVERYSAWVRRWYAHMLIDRGQPGDREKARGLVTEAIDMYRQMGMPKHVEIAEALLGEV